MHVPLQGLEPGSSWSDIVCYRGGGGVSWHLNFAWEISRFKLTAKFPTRNSGFSANFSYTTSTHSTHCGLWRGVIHLQ